MEGRPYAPSTFHPPERPKLTVGQHYPSLTTRAVPLSRAGCYFVEEIMKKRLRHRVRVIGILFVFAVSIGPISFTMAAGKNEARVTQGNSQCAIARTERS